ncbi:hypothetical protein ACFOLG_15940 [Vogesella facilis]|uniref:Uncharacterized protein n=1 Tax=Vogesella facilis TaxID=1655232 RepID=A0ABV7RJR1_9NEIS
MGITVAGVDVTIFSRTAAAAKVGRMAGAGDNDGLGRAARKNRISRLDKARIKNADAAYDRYVRRPFL